MADGIAVNYETWAKAIRQRDGRKCVKCGYHHASPHAIDDGHVLCDACVNEWEALRRTARCPVTEAEWIKLPSLIQFIQEYRK